MGSVWVETLIKVTSLLAAHLADKYGRRWTMRTGAFLFSIGGVFQTFCNGYRVMVFGRFVSGCGVGMLSMVVPIYQAESECARVKSLTPSLARRPREVVHPKVADSSAASLAPSSSRVTLWDTRRPCGSTTRAASSNRTGPGVGRFPFRSSVA